MKVDSRKELYCILGLNGWYDEYLEFLKNRFKSLIRVFGRTEKGMLDWTQVDVEREYLDCVRRIKDVVLI